MTDSIHSILQTNLASPEGTTRASGFHDAIDYSPRISRSQGVAAAQGLGIERRMPWSRSQRQAERSSAHGLYQRPIDAKLLGKIKAGLQIAYIKGAGELKNTSGVLAH